MPIIAGKNLVQIDNSTVKAKIPLNFEGMLLYFTYIEPAGTEEYITLNIGCIDRDFTEEFILTETGGAYQTVDWLRRIAVVPGTSRIYPVSISGTVDELIFRFTFINPGASPGTIRVDFKKNNYIKSN